MKERRKRVQRIKGKNRFLQLSSERIVYVIESWSCTTVSLFSLDNSLLSTWFRHLQSTSHFSTCKTADSLKLAWQCQARWVLWAFWLKIGFSKNPSHQILDLKKFWSSMFSQFFGNEDLSIDFLKEHAYLRCRFPVSFDWPDVFFGPKHKWKLWVVKYTFQINLWSSLLIISLLSHYPF